MSNHWHFDDLLKNIRPETVEDLSRLALLFTKSSPEIINSKNYILNPTFSGSLLVGDADADIILNKCLWDIKTVVDPKLNFHKWPYQLLGYCFLDTIDEFHLNSVGIYLSRQKKWISWPIENLIEILGGDPKIPISDWRIMFERSIRTSI